MSERYNRRDFLVAAGTAATLVASGQAVSANDTLNVGLIGTGGRCHHLMQALVKVPGVRVNAACDVWDVALKNIRPKISSGAFVTKNYKELLDRKDVDAVLIASPDHWHVPLTIAACEAGKDVYVEKPLTHDLAEGKAVIDAQNKNNRIVQVGMQQRSMPHIAKARELVQAGRIGKVLKVRMTWNRNGDRVRRGPQGVDPKTVDWPMFVGNARKQPFDEYRFRNWRFFWDFGGGLFTDLMVHWVDVAHWVLGVEHPTEAVSIGDWVTARDAWETPDTVQTLMRYPGDIQMYYEGTFGNARAGAMIEFMGSDATLYIDRGRYEIDPERNRGKHEELILGTGPKGRDFYDKPDGELLHLTNWVECVKSRKTPTAPAEAGVSSASAAHLANQALRNGGVAKWIQA